MLVITRKADESIAIGDPENPIGYIRIVSISGNKARIGIKLPRSIDCHRVEALSPEVQLKLMPFKKEGIKNVNGDQNRDKVNTP